MASNLLAMAFYLQKGTPPWRAGGGTSDGLQPKRVWPEFHLTRRQLSGGDLAHGQSTRYHAGESHVPSGQEQSLLGLVALWSGPWDPKAGRNTETA